MMFLMFAATPTLRTRTGCRREAEMPRAITRVFHHTDNLPARSCPSLAYSVSVLPDWLSTAPISQPTAIGNRHHDQNFLRSRRIGH